VTLFVFITPVVLVPRTESVEVPKDDGADISEPFKEQFVDVEFSNPSYEYEQDVAIPHDTYGDHVMS